MIWPEIKLVWVEVGAEAQLRDEVAVWQPRCEGGCGGGEDGAASHLWPQVAVVVHIGVH